MKHNPHISLFLHSPSYGGAQKVTINLAHGLTDRGYDVDLVVSHGNGSFETEIDSNISLVDLGVPKIPGIGILVSVPYLRSYLQSQSPDILISNLTHANIATICASLISDSSTVILPTEHIGFNSRSASSAKSQIVHSTAKYLYHFADDIISVSEGVRNSVVSSTNAKSSTVLHNPINIKEIQSQSQENIQHLWLENPDIEPIVSVGRLSPQKDIDTLIYAFRDVHKSRPETRLILVGKGPERPHLEELVVELGLEDKIEFTGFVDNPYTYMRSASVFVLSSHYEGLPTVLIEALACGTSIVATNCPHGPETILSKGDYGRLVPIQKDSEMASAIINLLDNPIPEKKCISRAKDFSIENSVDEYVKYFEGLLE